jgi:hypothetical protein
MSNIQGKTRSEFFKEKWVTPEFRSKMANRKGRLGKKHTSQTKLLLSKYASERINEKNPNWRGEAVKKSALHQWIERKYGPAKMFICSFCYGDRGDRKMHWANVDGKYSRDISGWLPLCAACHVNYDRYVLGAKIGRQRKIKPIINKSHE